MMGKNMTVYDIAKEAGVSVATVSRVINGNNKVAENTRRRVQDIIDKYEFKPNELARSLYKNETKMIGCILPDITNPYYSSVFLEAENYAMELGYTLVVCDAMEKPENDSVYLQTLAERQVDGIIYMGRSVKTGTNKKNFEILLDKYSEKLPIVMLNWETENKKCYIVKSLENQGFELLLQNIAQAGFKKVALIGGRTGIHPTDVKIEVYEKARKEYGFAQCPEYRIESEYTIEAGFLAMNRLLDLNVRPEVVMGMNDMIAVGALKACHTRHIRVPEDVKITGFDNIPLAHYIFPTLTTVSHNYKMLGVKAIDIIIDKINGENPKAAYEYEMDIIRGESF